MRIFLLICLTFSSFVSYTQAQQVSGRVTSKAEPGGLPGVSVVVKGTSVGTITDIDGNFTIQAQPGATLVISYVGHKTQEVVYTTQSSINVVMEEESTVLGEVVVTG